MTIHHYLRDFDATAEVLNDGMSKAVAGLAGGLSSHGVRNVILCEGKSDLVQLRADGVEVRCFDNSTTRDARFALAPGLTQWIAKSVQPGDLVILNAIFHTSVMKLGKLCRASEIKYIVAPHDPYHPAIFQNGKLKKWLYWYLFERPTLRNAAAVQVLDRRHGELLRELGVKTPTIEVYNGFSYIDVPNESTLSWRTEGAPSILFLGRIDRQNKGIDLLIQAFADLPSSFSNSTLTIQGPDRGERAALEQLAADLNIAARVTFLGPDYARRPGDLAAEHDIFCLPSRFEGFGLSAMEAMLAGRPVLITRIAGLAEHVARCRAGVVVDSDAPSICAGLIELLARRAQWREMGLRGRAYVLDRLDWKQIAGDALNAYRKLVT